MAVVVVGGGGRECWLCVVAVCGGRLRVLPHPSPGPSAHTHARVTVQRPLTVPPNLIKSTLPHHQAPPCCWYVCDKSVWPFDINDKFGHAPFGQHARIFHIIEGPKPLTPSHVLFSHAPPPASSCSSLTIPSIHSGFVSPSPHPRPTFG